MNNELLNLVPSTWRPSNNYPELRDARQIAVDVETYDPNLLKNGPGAIRKDGYVIGFSVATDDGFKGYYPIRHPEDNVDNPDGAVKWLKAQMSHNVPKVGANILYDLIWMKYDLGIKVTGKKYDVQIAEPLINENRSHYTLDAISRTYLGEGKREDKLLEAGKLLLGIKSSKKIKKECDEEIIKKIKGRLWELPARYVGEYGEADADLPIKIFKKQIKILGDFGLLNIFEEVETPLVDLLLEMWIKGIPVDVERGEAAADKLSLDFDKTMRSIKRRVGFTPDVWSTDDIVKACEKLGLTFLRTSKGNPSFTADWLRTQEHPFFRSLLRARQLDRSGSVFIRSKILDLEVNGRIHPQFWQVKNERYGTASGRFSSSNPNAQQFPARNEELAKIVRSILVAEGDKRWVKFDYSQQEFRITVHYAKLLNLPGSQKAMQRYINEPETDYHQMVADMTSLPRKLAKCLNLGLSYGMGIMKFSQMYNIPYNDAKKYYNQYHKGLPFVKELSNQAERAAKRRGYVKTILERRCNFNLYGPPNYVTGQIPKMYEEAIREFGKPVVQYFTYRAMNRVVQGSAADMIKKAMIDCYKAGYVPSITVHDELDFSDIEDDQQIKEIHDLMVNAISLRVPNVVDIEVGKNWGELEETL